MTTHYELLMGDPSIAQAHPPGLIDSLRAIGLIPNSLCGCATCAEALATAMKVAEQTLEHQCGNYLFTHATFLKALSRSYMIAVALRQGMTPAQALAAAIRDDEDMASLAQVFVVSETKALTDWAEKVTTK